MRRLLALFLIPTVAHSLVGEEPSKWLKQWNVPTSCDVTYAAGVTAATIQNDLINRQDWRVFCVVPGTQIAVLTLDNPLQGGKSGLPRVLMLSDGKSDHPKSFGEEAAGAVNSARIDRITFTDISHFVVYRLSSHNNGGTSSAQMTMLRSSNIILDRNHFYHIQKGIRIYEGSHYITVQRNFIGPMTIAGRAGDNVCVETINSVASNPDPTTVRINRSIHIVDNEFRDCNDAIQSVIKSADPNQSEFADVPDMIVDGNLLWFDERFDADGTPNPDGLFTCGENYMDFKTASWDPDYPMIVSNNRMHGLMLSYEGGTGCGSPGSNGAGAIVSHNNHPDAIFENNIFVNSGVGISCTGLTNLGDRNPKACSNTIMRNNYFIDIGYDPALYTGLIGDPNNLEASIGRYDDSETMYIVGNYARNNIWTADHYIFSKDFNLNRALTDSIFACNVTVQGNSEADTRYLHPTLLRRDNFFQAVEWPVTASVGYSNVVEPTYDPDDWDDISWQYDIYSGSPRTFTATDAVPSAQLLARLPAACRFGPEAVSSVTATPAGSSVSVSWTLPTLRTDGTTAFAASDVFQQYVELETDHGGRLREKVPAGTLNRDINVDAIFPSDHKAMRVRVIVQDNTMLAESDPSAWVSYDARAGALATPSNFDVVTSDGGQTFAASWTLQNDPVTVQQYNSAQARWDDLRTVTDVASTELTRVGSPNGANWEFRAVSRRFAAISAPTTTIQVPVP